MENQSLDLSKDEVFHQEHKDFTGYSSQITISQSMIDRIMNKSFNIQRYQGFLIGQIHRELHTFSLRSRKHQVIYRITRRELTLPIELMGNQVEMQLIPFDEIREELQRMKPEMSITLSWIHIGAVHIILKSALPEGIDIIICDKR